MASDWSKFVAFVEASNHILVMTHVRPDGDALGSQLALVEGLRAKGKVARAVIASALPDRYAFVESPDNIVERFVPPLERFAPANAIIVIDTGTWNQLGDFGAFMRASPAQKFVIDHHRTQDDLGGERIVDITAEAAGRLAYEALDALGVPMTKRIAELLFMALATDTGWFRHASATPRTFALAEKLVAAGASPTLLYGALYESNTAGRLRLTGRVLERLRLDADGRIASLDVTFVDYAATGGIPYDTEDLINLPRSIVGVEVALVFIEQENNAVKVSFRSKDRVDVDKIAERFGGGGHRLASGASVAGSMAQVREQVLALVREALPHS